jgi:hypothetical protein
MSVFSSILTKFSSSFYEIFFLRWITLSNLRKFTKSSFYNIIITCLFQISKKLHKNLLLYTQGEEKFAARDCLSPAMVRSSQVAARRLALWNCSNFKKVYTIFINSITISENYTTKKYSAFRLPSSLYNFCKYLRCT